MVTVDRIQRGVSRYLDEQLLPHLTGKDKWIVSGIATIALTRLPELMRGWTENPTVKALGIISDTGTIDIDMIANAIRPAAKQCSAQINIPLAGTITLTEQDIDNLINYIHQS